MRLTNKVAVITGGSRGIGKAVSLAFAREGADVVVGYHASAEKARTVQGEIEALGRRALTCQADVSNRSQVEQLMRTAVETLGRIDILANVAGITMRSAMEELSEEDWDRVIDTNLKGTFLCSQAAAQFMIGQGGGNIINIGSVSGLAAHCNRGGVRPQQGGGRHVIQGDGGGVGRAQHPRKHDQSRHDRDGDDRLLLPDGGDARQTGADDPQNRFVQPEEVAAAAVFLASEDAAAITGHSLVIDGGFQNSLFQLMERLLT